ncbi:hypothetical protein [Vibrio crassostreae]|uniref:hypothetical protein n=1 Tax=Vibrio crassostreae TaxID=246167 RepID=UPI001B3012FF|nr:hypothetical protein [Vibrio crassostreae]
MKQRQFRKGYMLVEAILGVTLISMAQVYWLQSEHEQKKVEKAAIFARSLSDVIHAMDKRILLDGRVDKTTDASTGVVTYGNWDATWTGNTAFVDQMIKRELVGRNNPQCGSVSNGWDAKLSVGDTEALVPCSALNPSKIPFDFTIDAKRSSINSTNKHVLKDWYFVLYHDTQAKFQEHSNLYQVIREKAKVYDVLEMTGRHDISLVDRTDSNFREFSQASECIKAEERCGILFRYRNSQASTASEDTALRTDGGNSMMGDLVFRTSAGNPTRCYNDSGEDVSCGFQFDVETGELNTSAKKMTATNFHLIYENINSNIPITTTCDKGASAPDSHSCGISLVGSGVSVEAEAYFDELHTNEVRFERVETANPLTIRESFDSKSPSYNNRLEIARDSVQYHNNSHGQQGVYFGSSLTLDSGSKRLNVSGDGALFKSTGNINLSADTANISGSKVYATIKDDRITSGHFNTSRYGKVQVVNEDNQSEYYREVATSSSILDGTHIVKIDKRVPAGSTIAKATCPTHPTLGTPSVQAYGFPSNGFSTLIISDSGLYNRCSLTTNGGTSSGGFVSSSSSTSQYSSSCEINNTDAKITYSVTTSSGKWLANFKIQEAKGSKTMQGGTLTIVQYCNYPI